MTSYKLETLSIQGTYHAKLILVYNMGIDHCCLETRMPQKFLDRSDIMATFQQMSGKTMP